MWHLIEDFFDQNLIMKAFLGLGWLSVLIMVCSLAQQSIASTPTAAAPELNRAKAEN